VAVEVQAAVHAPFQRVVDDEVEGVQAGKRVAHAARRAAVREQRSTRPSGTCSAISA
jgi:hypothetical protein